jgi:hypothetical protein
MRARTACPIARPVGSTTGVRTPCTRGVCRWFEARTVSLFSSLPHSPLSANRLLPMGWQVPADRLIFNSTNLPLRPTALRWEWLGVLPHAHRPFVSLTLALPTPLCFPSMVRKEDTTGASR